MRGVNRDPDRLLLLRRYTHPMRISFVARRGTRFVRTIHSLILWN